MRRTKKQKMDKEFIFLLIHRLAVIEHNRKHDRKLASKILKEYSSLISNSKERKKAMNYFSDLVDKRVINILDEIYNKI